MRRILWQALNRYDDALASRQFRFDDEYIFMEYGVSTFDPV